MELVHFLTLGSQAMPLDTHCQVTPCKDTLCRDIPCQVTSYQGILSEGTLSQDTLSKDTPWDHTRESPCFTATRIPISQRKEHVSFLVKSLSIVTPKLVQMPLNYNGEQFISYLTPAPSSSFPLFLLYLIPSFLSYFIHISSTSQTQLLVSPFLAPVHVTHKNIPG